MIKIMASDLKYGENIFVHPVEITGDIGGDNVVIAPQIRLNGSLLHSAKLISEGDITLDQAMHSTEVVAGGNIILNAAMHKSIVTAGGQITSAKVFHNSRLNEHIGSMSPVVIDKLNELSALSANNVTPVKSISSNDLKEGQNIFDHPVEISGDILGRVVVIAPAIKLRGSAYGDVKLIAEGDISLHQAHKGAEIFAGGNIDIGDALPGCSLYAVGKIAVEIHAFPGSYLKEYSPSQVAKIFEMCGLKYRVSTKHAESQSQKPGWGDAANDMANATLLGAGAVLADDDSTLDSDEKLAVAAAGLAAAGALKLAAVLENPINDAAKAASESLKTAYANMNAEKIAPRIDYRKLGLGDGLITEPLPQDIHIASRAQNYTFHSVNGKQSVTVKASSRRDALLELMEQRKHTKDLSGFDLRNLDMRGLDLKGWSLEYADLRGSNLAGADCRWARFGHADLSPFTRLWQNGRVTCLDETQLDGANFAEANLAAALMRNVTGDKVNFTRANLIATDWRGEHTALTNPNFEGARLAMAAMEGGNFTDSYTRNASLDLNDVKAASFTKTDTRPSRLDAPLDLKLAEMTGAVMANPLLALTSTLNALNIAGLDEKLPVKPPQWLLQSSGFVGTAAGLQQAMFGANNSSKFLGAIHAALGAYSVLIEYNMLQSVDKTKWSEIDLAGQNVGERLESIQKAFANAEMLEWLKQFDGLKGFLPDAAKLVVPTAAPQATAQPTP